MSTLDRVRSRVTDLLAYFSSEYTKAYKTALILHIRSQKNVGKEVPDPCDRPEHFQIMLAPDEMEIANPQLEGEVFLGSSWKDHKHWSMAKNFLVTETPGKKSEQSHGSVQAVAPQSPMSLPASGSEEGHAEPQAAAVWLPDDSVEACMNPACAEKFTLFNRRRHCRLCGGIFCRNCRNFRLKGKEDKFCEPCFHLRSNPDSPEAQLPLVKRPVEKTRLLNFYKYKAELTDIDIFTNAGALDSAKKAAAELGCPEGKHLLILSHRRKTRPQMIIACNSADERDKWRTLIQAASHASPAPITQDPVLRQAFVVAFERLRWRAWVWSSWEMDGTEAELLTDVLTEVIDREIMSAELSKLPAPVRSTVQKGVERIITPAVAACWTGLVRGRDAARVPVEKAAEGMLGPMFEQETKIKEKLRQPLEEAANKALDKAESQLQESLGKYFPVLAAAAEAQLNMLHSELSQLVEKSSSGSASVSDFQRDLWWARWSAGWLWCGPQKPITVMLHAKLNGDASTDASRALADWICADLKDLQQSAFAMMKKVAAEAAAAAPPSDSAAPLIAAIKSSWNDIALKSAHDIHLLLQWRVLMALDRTLRPPLLENSSQLLAELSAPLQDAIPEMLRDVVDPERMGSEIIDNVLTSVEVEIVERAMQQLKKELTERGAKLAQQGIGNA